MDVEITRMEDGAYPADPSTTRVIKTDVSKESGEKTAYPSTLIGDVNGDDRQDLLVGRPGKELRVSLGVPGPEVFAHLSATVDVSMPAEGFAWLEDLNRDGKQDVVLHHVSASEAHRVTLLIAE